MYITDNIIATTNAFNSKKMTNTIINIGSSKMFTILDLAKKIISITNSKSQLVFKPERKSGDTKIRQPSNETFLELIGKSKLINLETGIRKIIDSISK